MRSYLIILWILSLQALQAQDLPPLQQQQWETSLERGSDEAEDESLLQQLHYLQQHPLDINAASETELISLRLLSSLQVAQLLRHRQEFGFLIDVHELQAVRGWDLATIQRLLPYIKVGVTQAFTGTLLQRLKRGSHLLMLTWTRRWPFSSEQRYLGDANRLTLRYRAQYKNLLYWGVLGDKDPGEAFFKGAQRLGFDFYSFHFFLRDHGRVRALALGDYTLNLGQGLLYWQSGGWGKGGEVSGISKAAPVFTPYRSPGEFRFLRGAAITLQWNGSTTTSFFVSHRRYTASISTDSVFTSLNSSGLHRTAAEAGGKGAVGNWSFGGNLSWQRSRLKLGVNLLAHRFSYLYRKRPEPYQLYSFQGKSLHLASVDYAYTYRNIHLFGEWASDQRLAQAFVGGALLSLHPRADLSLLYRRLSPSFHSLFGDAFTESTLPNNEEGGYTGVMLRPGRGWELSGYVDLFSFSWLRYRADAPGRGSDLSLQLQYRPSKKARFHFQYRIKSKPENEEGIVTDLPVPVIKKSLRLGFEWVTPDSLRLQGRADLARHQKGGAVEEGGSLWVEGSGQLGQWRWGIRLHRFDTESYNSRIYSYESNVLYGGAVPAFSGNGWRWYLNLKRQLDRRFKAELRWSQTFGGVKEGDPADQPNMVGLSECRIQLTYNLK